MDLGLKNQVALVTAASSGLGAATAAAFAREGARVAICARGQERLERTAAQIAEETGADLLPIVANVSQPGAAERLVDQTVERFGRLDVLVTNAGGPPSGAFLDLAPEDWQAASQLSLMSVVRLCYAAVPVMREQKRGSILAITSVSVKQPLDNLILSNALRLGVVGLVKSLSNELATDGVRVNAICPGWTRTSRVDELLQARAAKTDGTPDEVADQITAAIPMGRMATPDEFARAAVFIASPAASYITGVSLLVDGGMYKGAL